MTERKFGEEQLALMLQAARDFAFQQLEQAGHFVPFAAYCRPEGEIEFVRFANEDSEEEFDDLYRLTQANLAEQARQGELLAAASVAHVGLEEMRDGCERAIRIHVEAPGHSRMVLAPYRLEPSEDGNGRPRLVGGKLIPFAAPAAVFAR